MRVSAGRAPLAVLLLLAAGVAQCDANQQTFFRLYGRDSFARVSIPWSADTRSAHIQIYRFGENGGAPPRRSLLNWPYRTAHLRWWAWAPRGSRGDGEGVHQCPRASVALQKHLPGLAGPECRSQSQYHTGAWPVVGISRGRGRAADDASISPSPGRRRRDLRPGTPSAQQLQGLWVGRDSKARRHRCHRRLRRLRGAQPRRLLLAADADGGHCLPPPALPQRRQRVRGRDVDYCRGRRHDSARAAGRQPCRHTRPSAPRRPLPLPLGALGAPIHAMRCSPGPLLTTGAGRSSHPSPTPPRPQMRPRPSPRTGPRTEPSSPRRTPLSPRWPRPRAPTPPCPESLLRLGALFDTAPRAR